MSVNTVQNALLDILQKNPNLHADFSTALTGTASATGASLTGAGIDFVDWVSENDYIGNPTRGFRRVVELTSEVITVDRPFDADFTDEEVFLTHIKKGLATMEDISLVGKKMRLAFVSSEDIDLEIAKQQGIPVSTNHVLGCYHFILGIIFSEPNMIVLDERKGNYDKWIRDAIDPNMTLNNTCVGITVVGPLTFIDHPEDDNIHMGAMEIICFPRLQRGNR